MTDPSRYRAEPRHTELGPDFYDEVDAARFPKHLLRHRDQRFAARVGLDALDDEAWIAHFGRFEALPGNLERPLALRYHGHQFRNYNPELGDGRGFLFAQLRDCEDGRLLDLATKGSGTTPWSRGGDGRLTLKGGVREVLATSLLEALGVYTSKSFSLIETGEALERGDEPSPTRSCVLVRLGHSHLRFGSFQRQAAQGRPDNVRKLVDYSIAHYLAQDPAIAALHGDCAYHGDVERSEAEWEQRAVCFLRAVLERSAGLAASWMVAGFVHGVLNSDNMNVTGESFDYGPYRFLPTLDPGFTAAYFDSGGLYAYGRQPETVLWNLTRLAETLLPLAGQELLVAALETFNERFHAHYCEAMLERLGVRPLGEGRGADDPDVQLVNATTNFLHDSELGFERLFFDWYGGGASAERALGGLASGHYESGEFAALRALLEAREARDHDRLRRPYFQADAPCTLLIEQIEALWDPIAADDDWSAFEAKLTEIEAMRVALQS